MSFLVFFSLSSLLVVNFATELILPVVLRKFNEYRAGDSPSVKASASSTTVRPNEKYQNASDEDLFLAKVAREAALPEYNIFGQFHGPSG